MKKLLILTLAAALALSTLTGCFGKPTEERTQAEDPPAQTSGGTTTDTTPDPTPTEKPKPSGNVDVDAVDATPFNTKENAVPLGQWVRFTHQNYSSDEYVPHYIRITGVNRNPADVQAALDAYDGLWDLSLSDDQARDIEYGIIEYEIYFAPDFAAEDYGISPPSLTLSATPISTSSFETDGGMTYIGLGSMYNLDINGSSFRVFPGDTVKEQSLFTVLKNYDESEYVILFRWYEGEIETTNARETYFAVK